MPLYEFVADDGSSIEEIYLSYKDAPREITRDGRKYKRAVSAPQFYFVGAFSGGSSHVKSTETKATSREIAQAAASARKHKKKQQEAALDKALVQTASEIAV